MKRQPIVVLTMTCVLLSAITWARGADTAAAGTSRLTASSSVLVSQVTFDKNDSGDTRVDVSTSGTAPYHVMKLSNPARLVVDIEGARSSTAHNYLADTPVLKDVRVGQFRDKDPFVVRVVADLNGNPAYNVFATASGLRIELHAASEVKASPAPASARIDKKMLLAARVSASAAPAKPPVAPPVTSLPPADAGTGFTPEALKPVQPPTILAAAVPQQAAETPATTAATPETTRASQAAATLHQGSEATTPLPQTVAPANTAEPPPPAKVVYTGEPISLNLKDVDLKDFFRLIHEISGLNVIVDPNVSGTLTLVLDSVPWDQALDIVLKNNDLGKALEGNVLRIARMQTLTAEQESQTRLVAARIDAAPLVTIFRPLNYAKAAEVQTLLKTWIGGGALTRRGVVVIDIRSNTVIISDVPTQIPIIQNILDKVDRKAKQVSIEARVVLATAEFVRTLSSSLLGGFANSHTTTAGVTQTNANITIPPPTASVPFPVTTVTSATASGFGAASIVNVGANYFINAAISAAEERNQAKTISRPSIVTQNNLPGKVQQGVQVPIQTTINNTISVQYYPATLQLTVTPQVTDNNNIFMLIDVQNNSVGASVTGIGPEIATQQATTSVLVPDGGTVVFGGITVTSRTRSATYIPLLGSIPILGHLFKTSNNADNDQELLFFVSPKVLDVT